MSEEEYAEAESFLHGCEFFHERHCVGCCLGARGHECDVVDYEHFGSCLGEASLEVAEYEVGEFLACEFLGVGVVGVVEEFDPVEHWRECVVGPGCHGFLVAVGSGGRVAPGELCHAQLEVGVDHLLWRCLGEEFGECGGASRSAAYHVGYLHCEQ